MIVAQIGSYLPTFLLCKASEVNRKWRNGFNQSGIWQRRYSSDWLLSSPLPFEVEQQPPILSCRNWKQCYQDRWTLEKSVLSSHQYQLSRVQNGGVSIPPSLSKSPIGARIEEVVKKTSSSSSSSLSISTTRSSVSSQHRNNGLYSDSPSTWSTRTAHGGSPASFSSFLNWRPGDLTLSAESPRGVVARTESPRVRSHLLYTPRSVVSPTKGFTPRPFTRVLSEYAARLRRSKALVAASEESGNQRVVVTLLGFALEELTIAHDIGDGIMDRAPVLQKQGSVLELLGAHESFEHHEAERLLRLAVTKVDEALEVLRKRQGGHEDDGSDEEDEDDEDEDDQDTERDCWVVRARAQMGLASLYAKNGEYAVADAIVCRAMESFRGTPMPNTEAARALARFLGVVKDKERLARLHKAALEHFETAVTGGERACPQVAYEYYVQAQCAASWFKAQGSHDYAKAVEKRAQEALEAIYARLSNNQLAVTPSRLNAGALLAMAIGRTHAEEGRGWQARKWFTQAEVRLLRLEERARRSAEAVAQSMPGTPARSSVLDQTLSLGVPGLVSLSSGGGLSAYNLACLYALWRKPKKAKLWLGVLAERGQLKVRDLEEEPDFGPVRGQDWFLALLRARRVIEARQGSKAPLSSALKDDPMLDAGSPQSFGHRARGGGSGEKGGFCLLM